MLKPIETEYKGYLFRSRLEARWALFFDEMGYHWEYEPEGYELSDGTRYLPDFLLNIPIPHTKGARQTYMVEVKPSRDLYLEEAVKIYQLVQDSDTPVIILTGIPDFRLYQVLFKGTGTKLDIMYGIFDERLNGMHLEPVEGYDLSWFDKNNYPKMREAIRIARMFRFEYRK